MYELPVSLSHLQKFHVPEMPTKSIEESKKFVEKSE